MFDAVNVTIIVPSGPYAPCPDNCGGNLLPKVQPATTIVELGPGGVNGGYEKLASGTAVLFWECPKCNKRF